MIDDQQLADKISANFNGFLVERNPSVRAVAKLAGEYPLTISRIARGLSLPRIGTLVRIAEALDVSLDELVFSHSRREKPRTAD